MVNAELQMAGIDGRVDHRSHRSKGLTRLPLEHLGPAATALEDRGVTTAKGRRNKRKKRLNSRCARLAHQDRVLQRAIKSLGRELRYQATDALLDLVDVGTTERSR
jgi:hypothetical protein